MDSQTKNPTNPAKQTRASAGKLLELQKNQQAKRGLYIRGGLAIGTVVVIIGVIIGVSKLKSTVAPKPGKQYSIVSRVHIPEGSPRPTNYNSNPPSSGPHYPAPANWGVYTTQLPDQTMVHNLEHGGIWISYKDSTDTKLISQLTKLAKQFQTKIILEPRAENPAPISLVSWGWVENLQVFDQAKIVDFYNAHKDKGPEYFPDVPGV